MSEPTRPGRPSVPLVVVVAVVALQAVVLLVGAGWGVIEVIAGRVSSVPVALVLVALLAGIAAVLLVAVRALIRGSRFARSSLVAWHLLALATLAALAQATGLVPLWVSTVVPAAGVVALLAPSITRQVQGGRPGAGSPPIG